MKLLTCLIISTHEHELVRRFNHRVITIHKGQVVSDTGEKYAVETPAETVKETENKPETKEELMQAAEAELKANVEQLREEVTSPDIIEKKQNNTFYEQPNSDKELEEFMRNYGIEDIDYSKYLDDITDVNGGDAQ